MSVNAPQPKFMIESVWRGRVFGSDWQSAAGGSLDVLEPATGATLTRVGNAVAEDVRRAAAEARAAQPGCGRPPASSKTIRKS
jgi:benzaldehyde dehydrogenase (NAD)